MLVLTSQLRTSQSKKREARHMWSLTLGEKLSILGFQPPPIYWVLYSLYPQALECCPPGVIFTSCWCWATDVGVWYTCLHFCVCLRKQCLKGCGPKLPHRYPPTPSFPRRIVYIPPTLFHLNVVLGLRRPWYTKLLSKTVTWLTAKGCRKMDSWV